MAGINFRGTKWSIIGLLTFTRFFPSLVCFSYFGKLVSCRALFFAMCFLCECVVIRLFFLICLFYKSLWQDCDTHFYFSNVGDNISPTDKPLFARSLPILLLYNMNIILLYTIHYPKGIVFWGKGSIFSDVSSRRVLNILFYFCLSVKRELFVEYIERASHLLYGVDETRPFFSLSLVDTFTNHTKFVLSSFLHYLCWQVAYGILHCFTTFNVLNLCEVISYTVAPYLLVPFC